MGELVIIEAELEPIEPPAPIDIDALVGRVIEAEIVEEVEPAAPQAEPEVIDAEIVERPPWVSPLDGGGHKLHGGIVSEPEAREVISASVDYALRPWWWRLCHRRPAGYNTYLADAWRL